jgi:hypothetical protein
MCKENRKNGVSSMSKESCNLKLFGEVPGSKRVAVDR